MDYLFFQLVCKYKKLKPQQKLRREMNCHPTIQRIDIFYLNFLFYSMMIFLFLSVSLSLNL
jgi:hypothetical protein